MKRQKLDQFLTLQHIYIYTHWKAPAKFWTHCQFPTRLESIPERDLESRVTQWTQVRQLEKAVAVRNSSLEKFSGKFRHCWKIIHRFSGSTICYLGIVQKVFSPKGVPRIFDAFLTHFGTVLFPNKTRPILTHFWRISDAILLLPTPFPKTPFGRYRIYQGLGIFWQGKWLLENRPRLRERSWISSSETPPPQRIFWGYCLEITSQG